MADGFDLCKRARRRSERESARENDFGDSLGFLARFRTHGLARTDSLALAHFLFHARIRTLSLLRKLSLSRALTRARAIDARAVRAPGAVRSPLERERAHTHTDKLSRALHAVLSCGAHPGLRINRFRTILQLLVLSVEMPATPA